ncbi:MULTISPECIES: hypothetical protein [unclassified Streptomyces]|uniref:hypothetical protein n=1 Tax=unclassified Streptomyces TaxID=2593676 RepID=UPI00226D473E|nr:MULTISPECIES: hypothetical protein [unclassified Streptomyces]MCY0923514.1 hypothetical protein [Streptomyces sp. H27-G5]MCY0961642.1 hypothetical protein [Streptomyces sp. H27-H5]
MPVHLPEPEPVRPSDGKGYNRLSLNGHIGAAGPQCALLPRSYATLFESQDTRRARWGGFGSCIRDGACTQCPVLTAPNRRALEVGGDRVLVRVETTYSEGLFNATASSQLWMTSGPDAVDRLDGGRPWTWAEVSRLEGWELGRRYRDASMEGFWLHRVTPAPHGEVRSRAVGTSIRHAFLTVGTRACLMICMGGCRHDEERLATFSRHIPPVVDDLLAPPLPAPSEQADGGWRVRYSAATPGVLLLEEAGRPIVRVSISGSQWTAARLHSVGAALLRHVRRQAD